MTGFADDQAHMDANTAVEVTDLGEIVDELKAQHAKGETLDFTKADAFVAAMNTEVAADAPPAPPASPPAAAPSDGTVGSASPTNPAAPSA